MRTDIHRPSAINPAEYDFVCFDYMGTADLGAVMALAGERATFREHMARTGGRYSGHEHGGSCHVCGAWAIYLCRFYHAKTNTYIITGEDCAQKMGEGEADRFRAFRKSIHEARDRAAGKAKAQALLEDLNLAAAWAIFAAQRTTAASPHFEELTVADIVYKLVTYGSISDNQTAYLGKLLALIAERPAREAAQAAEKDAAAPVPVTDGRVNVEGDILSIKVVEGNYGDTDKCLIKTSAGWKLWVTLPDAIGNAQRGDRVALACKVEPSRDDPKFAFGKRPSKARIVARATPEA